MQIKPEQLASHLARGIAPIYIVSGDEPLQAGEALDTIRATAREAGYADRVVLDVGRGFDWGSLDHYADSLSLFSDKRIIDLRMPSGKPGDAGGKSLRSYASRPSPDNLLVISTGKLDPASRKTKWYTELDRAGVSVQVWPVEARQLPGWIQRRAQTLGLKLTQDSAAVLAERVEGNLLACMQELNKLYLLYGEANIGLEELMPAVGDSARFNVFELADSALSGDTARTLRVLRGLEEEAAEPTLVLWALAREIRTLAAMAGETAGGTSVDAVLQKHRVWPKRKPLLSRALKRNQAEVWREILAHAARLDRIIKGVSPGAAWDELRQLSLAVCGVRLFSPRGPYNDGSHG